MIVAIQSPAALEKCKNITIKKVMCGAREAQLNYLKHQFESACVDATALAIITVAEGLGFDVLATEMRSQLENNK